MHCVKSLSGKWPRRSAEVLQGGPDRIVADHFADHDPEDVLFLSTPD